MPRRSDRPTRHPRMQMNGRTGWAREFPDGSVKYDRRDHGPCNIDREGQAVNGHTTGSWGPMIQLTCARTIPSLVKATGGKYSRPASRRSNKKPKRPAKWRDVHYDPTEDLRERARYHLLLIEGNLLCFNLWVELNRKLTAHAPEALERERERDVARERCEVGRLRKAGKVPTRVLTGEFAELPHRPAAPAVSAYRPAPPTKIDPPAHSKMIAPTYEVGR
jgi:hypothetical protein